MKLIKEYNFEELNSLPSDWTVAVGEKWANNERQQYVNDNDHLFFENGLVIQATIDDQGIIKSGRLNTKDRFYFTYGKVEVIAKLQKGKGTLPTI